MEQKNYLKLLALGLDAKLAARLKTAVKLSSTKLRLSFAPMINPEVIVGHPDVLILYSSKLFARNTKIIRDILFHHPKLQIIMVMDRLDPMDVLGYFRGGITDIWTHPFSTLEIDQTLQRVRHRGMSFTEHPIRTALHLFSEPQMFESFSDFGDQVMKFLKTFTHKLFFKELKNGPEVQDFLKPLQVSPRAEKKLHTFLESQEGLVFGLSREEAQIDFLIKLGPGNHLYVAAEFLSKDHLREVLSPYIVNIIKSVRSYLCNLIEHVELQRLAQTDEITGLFNQRKLSLDLEQSITQYNRTKQSFTLLFIDIDYFKNVNDQYGHVIGSQLLIDMAEVLRVELRGTDGIYRYGGDEFIILLPKTSLEEAKKIAIRLLESVKIKEFKINDEVPYKLSLSIGMAEFPIDATSSKAMIEFADKMMYHSKKSGRGKVFHLNEVIHSDIMS
jgi:diguanylate cyclase (GGDEF)-like protein